MSNRGHRSGRVRRRVGVGTIGLVTACAALSSVPAPSHAAVAGTAIRAQWTTPVFGGSFNNPISAWAMQTMWQNTTASVSMRGDLTRMGYSTAQVDGMNSYQMIDALRGKPSGAGAPAQAPTVAAKPVVTLAPVKVRPKTVTITSGDLAGLTFPVTAATRYTPSKKRLMVLPLAKAMSSDPAIQQSLVEVIEAGLKMYDADMRAAGLVNDVAGSMAYFVAQCSYVATGVDPDSVGVVLLGKLLQQSLDKPGVKKISAADKQEFHEFLVGLGTLSVASHEVAKENGDTATAAGIADSCSAAGTRFLGVDLRKVVIGPLGIEVPAS